MRVGLGFASWECLYKVGIRHMAQSMIRNEIVFLRGLLCGVKRFTYDAEHGFRFSIAVGFHGR